MTIERYYLGCPIWSYKEWVGELFRRDAKPADYLHQYASVFNTVEGNTTFYGVPSEATVERWREDIPDEFRFCFKFPCTITHDKRLRQPEAETEAFLMRMAPLDPCLGPFLVQLPPSFGPDDLPVLETFLRHLPDHYRYVVEVRHRAFFAGDPEQKLNDLLGGLGVDLAIFDTRALRSIESNDPVVRTAQRKKPDLPTRFLATGAYPFFRFVAHPLVADNMPWLEQLAVVVAGWISEGRTPYVFMHSPYDFFAPQLAREFHRLLGQQLPVGTMPNWPADDEEPEPKQLSLF